MSDAVNGSASLDDATIVYTHDGSETATGSFSYTVSDGAASAVGTVILNVSPVNGPPSLGEDLATVVEGNTVSIDLPDLLLNDHDPEGELLTFVGVGDPTNGTVSLDGATITYAHDGSETATGSFRYSVSDGLLTSDGTVILDITPVKDPPVVAADRVTVVQGEAVSIVASLLLDNDVDPEGRLDVVSVGDAINGTVSLEGVKITYRHYGSETLTGGFSYAVSDGTVSASADVPVTVTPSSEPPAQDSRAAPPPVRPASGATVPHTPGPPISTARAPATGAEQSPASPVPAGGGDGVPLVLVVVIAGVAAMAGGLAVLLVARRRGYR